MCNHLVAREWKGGHGSCSVPRVMSFRAAGIAAGVLVFACAARPARAEAGPPDDSVSREPHRISAEMGLFRPPEEGGIRSGIGGAWPAFGLGYAYRVASGFELGLGLRYLRIPA